MKSIAFSQDCPDVLVTGSQWSGVEWLMECLFQCLPAGIRKSPFERSADAAGGPRVLSMYADSSLAALPSDAIRVVRSRLPALKIVLVFRNPIEVAWLHAQRALALAKGSPPPTTTGDWAKYLASRPALRRTDYRLILRRWEDAFGPEQIQVLFTEDLVADPIAGIRAVLGFLGLEPPANFGSLALPPRKGIQPSPPLGPEHQALLFPLHMGTSMAFAKRWTLPATWKVARPAPTQRRQAVGILPRFLGIGAQKAGTTWLHFNLKAHPRAYLPEVKETHFFDQAFERGLDYYSSLFAGADRRVPGEITPAYSILDAQRIAAVRRHLGPVKLLLFVRNPVERAWSHAVMSLVKKSRRNVAEVSDAEFVEHFRSDSSIHRGDYERILTNWGSVFPRDRIFIGFFEDIAARPKELLGEVYSFLELGDPADWNAIPYATTYLRGLSVPLPAHHRAVLTEIYSPKIKRLAAVLGPRVEHWLRSD